jgi:hypothetical protein
MAHQFVELTPLLACLLDHAVRMHRHGARWSKHQLCPPPSSNLARIIHAPVHPSWFSDVQSLLYNSTRFRPLCLA